jgi:hypothetical protein
LPGRSAIRAALAAVAATAALAAAAPALADIAFAPPRDVPVGVDAIALAVLGAGTAPDPGGGAALPVQRIALLAAPPAPAVTVVAIGGAGAVGALSTGALPGGSEPRGMAAADLDGDGRREVLVASAGTDLVSVFRAPDASGPLPPPASAAAGPSLRSLAVADLVGDANPDVAVVNADGVAVLAGDGTGGLGLQQVVVASAALTGGEPNAYLSGVLSAGDLTGDGRADLVVGVRHQLTGAFDEAPQDIHLLAAAGVGAFAPLGSFTTASAVASAELGDLDGDGRLDVLLVGRDPGTTHAISIPTKAFVAVRFGNGAGGLDTELVVQDGPQYEVVSQGPGPVVATAGDLDLDGRTDLLVAPGLPFASPQALDFRRNLAPRQLADPVRVAVPSQTRLLAALDLTADGAPNLVVSPGSQPQTIAVLAAVGAPAGSDLEFGDQQVGTAGLTLREDLLNRGTAPLPLGALALGGPAAGDFEIVEDGCSNRTLGRGGACPIAVRFHPTAAGRRTASVDATGRDGTAVRLSLTGTGTTAPVVPPPPPDGSAAQPLPTAATTCGVLRAGPRATIACAMRFRRTAGARVALRLVRERRAYARADALAGGLVPLRRLRAVPRGRYTVVTIVSQGTRSHQTRQTLVIRRAIAD